jgi:hypothetical protein
MAEALRRYDVVKATEGWELRSGGVVVSTYRNKSEAVNDLPHQVLRGTVSIHTEIGGIEEERTYPRSADPRKSPG